MVGKRRYVICGFSRAGAQGTGSAAERSILDERSLASLPDRTKGAVGPGGRRLAVCVIGAARPRNSSVNGSDSRVMRRMGTASGGHTVRGAPRAPCRTVLKVGTAQSERLSVQLCLAVPDEPPIRFACKRLPCGAALVDRSAAAGAKSGEVGSEARRGRHCGTRGSAESFSAGGEHMRGRHGFPLRRHFSLVRDGGNGVSPACGGVRACRGRQDHDGSGSAAEAGVRGRQRGTGLAAAESRLSLSGGDGSGSHGCCADICGPSSISATSSRNLGTMVAMKPPSGHRVGCAARTAHVGRRPAIEAAEAVHSGDIGALSGVRKAGMLARVEKDAESMRCAEFGPCGTGSPTAVLLAIAVDIASKTVNAGASRARERPVRRRLALPLAVTQRFDNKQISFPYQQLFPDMQTT